MRLFLSVLLVTLALCCSMDEGVRCPALVTEVEGFLFLGMPAYKATLQMLCDPPQEIIEAKMTVKACTDQMSLKNKMLISSTLAKAMENCK
ncbi:secretoglobin family 1D member 2-like [Lontra canadensis]|uniref:secretoglobin family 1D member 2-like n=1 Tax=Lontra canadensis TaxID=76717 RepID=UPI0013F2E2B4|nr:secretoglobin family 1D member 2-like [Lontra canadensis]